MGYRWNICWIVIWEQRINFLATIHRIPANCEQKWYELPLVNLLQIDSGDIKLMLKQEISRIPYQAKHRLSLWLQLHHIPGMQYQSPHLIAPMMVLHFLWIIRAILDGLHCAGRQWGEHDAETSLSVSLPITMTILSVVAVNRIGTNGNAPSGYHGVYINNKTASITNRHITDGVNSSKLTAWFIAVGTA